MKRTGKSKIAVVGWGRGMGHKGHMYLADAVISQAHRMGADPYFFVSKTVGKDDPLFPEEKIKIYQKVFPQQATIFTPQGNLNQALQDVASLGYQGVVLVVGADQKQAFQYLEKPNKEGVPVYQSFGFKKLKVISRQETPSKYAKVDGPRATPMREKLMDPYATDEDKFKVWRDAMPDSLGDSEVLDLMRKAEARLMGSHAKAKKLEESLIMHPDAKINVYYIAPAGQRLKVAKGITYPLLQKLVIGLKKKYNIDMGDLEIRPVDANQYSRSSLPDLAEQEVEEAGITRRGVLKGLAGAAAAGAAGKASAIAGAFPTPSHQQAMYKAAADSNRAMAAQEVERQRRENAAKAAKLAADTKDVERLNKVNYHGKDAPKPTNAEWDGDSDFLYLDGTQYAKASRMPISGDVPSDMTLVSTKEGRQVYLWTRRSLKGVQGHYFYPAEKPNTINEFAPGNGDDDKPSAEYEVYQCNPQDQFDWIGGPLMQTDDMGKAHGFAYFLWKKHPDKCFMIWQERSQGSRGGYGPEGSVLAPSKEVDEAVTEGLNDKPEAGDKITWYYSNQYPKIEGEVVGWKDGHLVVKSIDPSPRNTEKTVATYRVPKNNILSVEKQDVDEAYDGFGKFDAAEFQRHMEKLRAREELRKTDPMRALVGDLKDQDAEKELAIARRKKPEDDSMSILDPRHPGAAYTQGNQNIDEVSDKTLMSYLTKVDADSRKHKMDPTKRSDKKASKSVSGFSKAFNKLDSRKPDGSLSEDYLDE